MADHVVGEDIVELFVVHEEDALEVDLHGVYHELLLYLAPVFLSPRLVFWIPLAYEA